ncbi:unnamed protein product [Enterobius vermicularis]|uniref:Uncharacterized protein n=1 Tax=Enterobius vermicularis TaxID=51028 RepID=A0A0N4VRC2_ENTVE|nr:unnamed protein product [Enterobius vermicularis]
MSSIIHPATASDAAASAAPAAPAAAAAPAIAAVGYDDNDGAKDEDYFNADDHILTHC